MRRRRSPAGRRGASPRSRRGGRRCWRRCSGCCTSWARRAAPAPLLPPPSLPLCPPHERCRQALRTPSQNNAPRRAYDCREARPGRWRRGGLQARVSVRGRDRALVSGRFRLLIRRLYLCWFLIGNACVRGLLGWVRPERWVCRWRDPGAAGNRPLRDPVVSFYVLVTWCGVRCRSEECSACCFSLRSP